MKDLVSGASISPGQLRSIDRVRLFGKIGYIRVTSFESLVIDQEVSSVIKTLKRQGMTGLMIDLRGNGGGLLSSAINVSNLFLSGSVPIVHTVDRSGKYETDYSKKTAEFSTLPLIILVDETSASSSEILAGAIQDNGRGTIVGSHRTYGKATMQKVFVLPNGSAILYTAAKYLTPSGRDITKIGILPDVVVPPATGRREMSGGAMDSMIQEAIRRFGEAEK